MGPETVRFELDRDEDGGLELRWQSDTDHELIIRGGSTPVAADHTDLLTVRSSAQAVRLPAGKGRQYVSVFAGDRTVMLAERRVGFAGALNFRDIGGYPIVGGGQTRWGTVFRSDSLHKLTPEDLLAFDAMGIRSISDLRREEEREREPGPRPSLSFSLPNQRVADADPAAVRTHEDGQRWLLSDYLGMLERAGPAIGRLFAHLSEPDATPALIHCAGGKDRTGLSVVLLLSLLGVDRETVLDDYELTGRIQSAKDIPWVVDMFVEMGLPREGAEGMLSSPRWAMAEALDRLDSAYGGVTTYLLDRGELSPGVLTRLRDKLVDP
jgi:protein-tyrosine phosphatase